MIWSVINLCPFYENLLKTYFHNFKILSTEIYIS
jgi:hypothetical protein